MPLNRPLKKEAFKQENSFEFLYEFHPDAILHLAEDRRILNANISAAKLFNLPVHELSGVSLSCVLTEECFSESEKLIHSSVKLQTPYSGEVCLPSGRVCCVTSVPVLTQDDEQGGVFLNFHDVTDMRNAYEELRASSCFDELTMLPNDRTVMKKLEEITLNDSGRSAIIKVNISRFKYINEMFGKNIGDKIIKEIGQELRSSVPAPHFVGRFFNDEFVVVIENITDIDVFYRLANETAENFKTRFFTEGREYKVKVSFGAAIHPDHGTNPDMLLKKSDLALKINKESAIGTYSEEKSQAIERRYFLQKELMHALKRKELLLYYQPQYDTRTNSITGMEVLLRWNHPLLGIVSPVEFIPIAEETGLIIEIGKWSMHEACRQLKEWQATNSPALRLSMNLSIKQFYQPDLVSMVSRVLEENGISPNHFELEFTESLSMHNSEMFIRTIQELKNIKIHLSIDDFGTGYSSLSYLTQLPLDKIKIDRSFVHNMLSSKQDEIVIKAIIGLAENLGLQMIAEGVESEVQAHFLGTHGCHHMQGFLFSRPLPEHQITELLAKQSKSQLH
ncbi:EAL domain-containing protein [Metabacillus sp. 84]|uniref:sensor domain-containing protein n=1 Tax=unclassified Metabacillus TaxID=2675274 RepID=UPI003CEFD770